MFFKRHFKSPSWNLISRCQQAFPAFKNSYGCHVMLFLHLLNGAVTKISNLLPGCSTIGIVFLENSLNSINIRVKLRVSFRSCSGALGINYELKTIFWIMNHVCFDQLLEAHVIIRKRVQVLQLTVGWRWITRNKHVIIRM